MRIQPIIFSAALLLACLQTGNMAKAQHPVAHPQADTTDETNDLMQILEQEEQGSRKKEYVSATFKSTRIANGHSIENTPKGVLDFRISHRFGMISGGLQEFFGLDGATTRIGFDYGITDWLMVGVGRSTYLKEYDGFFKVKLLRQTEDNSMPFSLSYLGAMSVVSAKEDVPEGSTYYFSNRLSYVNQLLIARKFNQWLSLQIMPAHVHYNLVSYKDEPNDVFAVGLGGRIKLSNRISLTGEYYYVVPGTTLRDTHNALTLGIDIETGGHVFQLLFSNSTGITERTVIGQTTGEWARNDHNGRFTSDIHFGFNISRVFTIVRPKGFENSRNKIW